MKTKMAWPSHIPIPNQKPKLQLSGSDADAMAIIIAAQRAARTTNWTPEQIGAFRDIVKSGDYDNVLQTCMRYFDVS